MKKQRASSIETIHHDGREIAQIIRAHHVVDNLEFFTKDTDPLQVGLHNKKKGTRLAPHTHVSDTKIVSEIGEVLYIVNGKVRVTYYTPAGKTIIQKELSKGDVLIHHDMGHGFEILKDAVIFEVKQGPYPGTQHKRIFSEKART